MPSIRRWQRDFIPMPDVLFIKTSSLGDVIHHMPALTEAKARRPADRFAWVVEEAFAPLVRLHPAVDEVIPVAARRWRGGNLLRPNTWSQIGEFRRALRSRRYDEIVDTQGLFLKSAVIARSALGRRHGYDAQSIKEPTASWLYDVRHRVERNQHAVARNRMLTALALGYGPQGEPDYGLDTARIRRPAATSRYGVLLHATAQAGKEWPVADWRALTAELAGTLDLIVPWGTGPERARAVEIASGIARARVIDRQPLDEVARLIAGASFVVGVDTGLMHLAAALGVPLVAIFAGSEPGLTGPVGRGPIKVLGARGAPPDAQEVIAAVRQVTG
jgi:heptosyltransferase-1